MFWSFESWGADYPPENAAKIIEQANEMIEACSNAYGADAAQEYSGKLWERYCETGSLEPKNFASAVELMDDEIREDLHAEGIENPDLFLDKYKKRHLEKYGVPFEI